MSIEEIIKSFIMTGAIIYRHAATESKQNGEDVPDSVTVGACRAGDDKIEITITIKSG